MAISPAVRRTAIPKVEPSKDTTKSKVVIKEGTTAEITEQIGAKTVTYSAEIKEDDTKPQELDDMAEDEDSLLFNQEPNYEEVPQNKLDMFFDNIEDAQETDNQVFFANVTRLPDALSDSFNYPCNAEMPLGVFQFSLRDRFTFLSAIQKKNNNSGGYFNITVYDRDNKPLQRFLGYEFERGRKIPRLITVGIRNLLVANPPKEEVENSNNSTSLLQVLVQMNQKSDERLEKLLVALKPEKSVFEKALEQKMMNDILNPSAQKTGFSMEETMSEVMKSAVVMSSFGDAFSKMLNREPPEPKSATTMDTIKEIMNFPLVRDAGEMILNTLDTIATQKLIANGNTVNPNQLEEGLAEGNTEEMELITKVVAELESENVIDKDNETIKELMKDYPDAFNDLKTMCQICQFEQIFSLLLTKSQKIKPSPFAQFIDAEKTTATNTLTWNERGVKIIPRLQQVYELVKTM